MRLTRANFDLQIAVLTTQVSQVRFQQTFQVLEPEEKLYHFLMPQSQSYRYIFLKPQAIFPNQLNQSI